MFPCPVTGSQLSAEYKDSPHRFFGCRCGIHTSGLKLGAQASTSTGSSECTLQCASHDPVVLDVSAGHKVHTYMGALAVRDRSGSRDRDSHSYNILPEGILPRLGCVDTSRC